MTPEGHRRLQDELRQLSRVERPEVVETVAWAAGNCDCSVSAACGEIDRRIVI